MLVTEKVAPRRSPMTVYGLPSSALADDEAPATSLLVPFLSVCPLHLPLSSLPLTLLSSSTLPAPSCLLTFSPPLCLYSFFFLAVLRLPWLPPSWAILQPFPAPPPKPPFTPQQPVPSAVNDQVFSFFLFLNVSFPPLFTHAE